MDAKGKCLNCGKQVRSAGGCGCQALQPVKLHFDNGKESVTGIYIGPAILDPDDNWSVVSKPEVREHYVLPSIDVAKYRAIPVESYDHIMTVVQAACSIRYTDYDSMDGPVRKLADAVQAYNDHLKEAIV